MPNWCTNSLSVVGTPNDIARFRADIAPHIESREGLTGLFPLPAEAHKEVVWTNADGTETRFTAFAEASDGGVDGYAMAVALWGTKWGDCETAILSENDTQIVFGYQTAWGPAQRLIERLSSRYPTLVFGEAFVEESNDIAGYAVYFEGEQKVDEGIDIETPDFGDPDDDEWFLRWSEHADTVWSTACDARDCAMVLFQPEGIL